MALNFQRGASREVTFSSPEFLHCDVITKTPPAWCEVAWYPAHRKKSAWYTLMRFRLIKNGVAHVLDVYTV